MNNMIETVDVCKTFQMGQVEVEALKNINLTVERGEFISIMGPSGSGKSTLLYLLGALDKPTSGKIEIGGKELSVMDDKQESLLRRREIGFVFQFYNLIPNLNVEENVMLPLLLDGKSRKNHRDDVDQILKLVGLADRKQHTPRELSGGQQQRVAIARALINKPDVILADEPTGNLDSETEEEIMELFAKINQEQGETIVQVTHSTKTAAYGTRIVNLKDGEVDKK
ncbi:MAG: ABC transporter ATP-binding protein [Bacillota bacterium]